MVSDGYHAGTGCYDFHGTIVSSLIGYVHVIILKNSVKIELCHDKILQKLIFQQGDDMNIVEVRKKFDESSHLLPSQGKIVTARVVIRCAKL